MRRHASASSAEALAKARPHGDTQPLRPPRRASPRVEARQRVGVGPHAQLITMTKDTIKDLAPHDRPREKLERGGVATLGDNELLALLIGHGTAGANALAIANRVLAACQ